MAAMAKNFVKTTYHENVKFFDFIFHTILFFFSNVILTTITRYIDFISFCIISRLAAQNQNNFPYFGCFLDHATLVLSTSSLDFEKIRKTFLKSAEDISTVRLFF